MEEMINCLGRITIFLVIFCIGAYEEIKSSNLIKASKRGCGRINSKPYLYRHYRKLRNILKPYFTYDSNLPICYVKIEDNGVSKNA